ncbi:carboxypeptidase-like regulatory domain-containing protein [Myxococcus sp. K38C18041901]|uniref:carboxypeptidase-like regulatory domain-containing protein n=1 Tax=Myxococcus guangdongensis TaxID=2906760 RepID=UPI0020A78ADA|nr:carboxypeptidase-like regulatory domain-containing protein [Myxococcus guangdongensis]MCP3060518.1 carboxypeptidase-like regulatory domain-containing protein [Myxococcus guangdongensis]
MARSGPWLLCLWLGLLLSCGAPLSSEELPSKRRPSIRVTYEDGQPAAGASVRVNDVEQGPTDSDGRLELTLPSGPFRIELSVTGQDGSFTRAFQDQDGDAPEGWDDVPIHLPRPVRLLEPLEVTTTRVQLQWQRSHERSFREYRVYGHRNASALDDSNSVLLFVGTDNAQTRFTVGDTYFGGTPFVTAHQDLHFRVYVQKDDGSLSGSNILHVKTPAWANEDLFTRRYTLEPERNFAGTLPIRGVAHDGSALWLLYHEESGGGVNLHRLTLARLDPQTLAVLQSWSFLDNRRPRGLTWDGTSLWLYLEANGHKLVRFNPTTGARDFEFVAGSAATSLAWSGTHLLLSAYGPSASVTWVHPVTGAITDSWPSPFNQRALLGAGGIAHREGETWLASPVDATIVIIGEAGAHIGVATSPHAFASMAFLGDRLVGVTHESQVHVLRIEP